MVAYKLKSARISEHRFKVLNSLRFMFLNIKERGIQRSRDIVKILGSKRIFMMQKYPFITAQDFSFISSKIFYGEPCP